MNDASEKLLDDPFLSSPIPGQSLTSSPGVMPYEKPPMTASPVDAYMALKEGLYQPDTQKEIAGMVLAGLTCETVATSFVMIAFSKGMFNPDVAEIIKPFLTIDVFKIAKMNKVQDVVLENSVKAEHSGDISDLRALGQELSPHNRIVQEPLTEEDRMKDIQELESLNSAMGLSDNMESEGFMTRPQGVEE